MPGYKNKVDVATYAFSCAAMALGFTYECGANHLTASLPSPTKSGWTVRVLIPSNAARERADKCADGAPVVHYQFQALPESVEGLQYPHF